MPLQLIVRRDLPYLVVEMSGPAGLAEHRGMVALVAAVCAAAPYRKCLIDLRGIQTELAFTEHLQLGSYAGESFSILEKVASVVTPELRNGTSERAAQKAGARLRTFMDIEEAKAWLSS